MTSKVADGRLEELQIYRLLQYVQESNKGQIERLVNMGVDDLINLTEPLEGKGVLYLASVANDTDMVEFLIGQGARPDVQDKRGRTPVMLAAELGHDGVVSLLAKKNADMKLVDVEGKGVLFYCVFPTKRHMRCLQAALNSMADVNNVSQAGVPLLMQACENALECEGMCLSLLERGADPNATNQVTGCTALMEAVKAGAVGLVRAILKRGANVNASDTKNFQAVHFAAELGYFEIIRVLSAYAADMGGITAEGNTALHYAAHGGFANCCRFLAQRGCNPKLKNLEGLLPRQIAKDLGHKASLKELKRAERLHGKFSKGSGGTNEPWALTLHDWSHEHEADLRKAFDSASDGIVGIEVVSRQTFVSVLRGLKAPVEDEHIQRILIAHDRRREGLINIIDFLKGFRYLPKSFVMASYEPRKKKRAAKGGKTKKIKLNLPLPICAVPPELLYRRDDGGPPHFMIENYHLITDPNRFDRDHPPGHPVEDDSAWYVDDPGKVYVNISYCVKTGDIASLKLAFSQKVPGDVKDQYYKTPLMTACGSGNYEVAKFLLDRGADVNARDQFSWTPLHHACHAGQLDIIELLVEAGAAVDAPALSGATPLMRAIESCRPCCVDYLLKAGATVTVENKTEQNCLDIARAYADQRIVELIQAKMNSLYKARDKKDKAAKPQTRPRPLTSMSSKEKYLDSASSQQGASSTAKTTVKADSVILHSTQITSGTLNKVDISFQPRTVWGKQLTTRQLMEKKEERRQRFTSEVDFEDFRMPFNKNLRKKTVDLTETFE